MKKIKVVRNDGMFDVLLLRHKGVDEMKVKDLIEELSKLDQEKGIWCIYDGFALISLVPEESADEWDASNFKNEGMELGDYVISAG